MITFLLGLIKVLQGQVTKMVGRLYITNSSFKALRFP